MLATAILASTMALHAPAPITMTGAHAACTGTTQRYLLANDGNTVTYSPGSIKFTAETTRPRWDDTYLLNGWSRGKNSADTCGSFPYVLPVPATGFKIRGSMTSTWSGLYARPGWDIWLVHKGVQDTETTNTAMQADPRTVELLLQPGHQWHSSSSATGWHRIFTNAGDLADVDITSMICKSLEQQGLRPSDYYLEALGAGAEMWDATFHMTGYSLSVTPVESHVRLPQQRSAS